MKTISATEAKQNFAALLDAAQRGPVRIRRHDREVAVVLSAEEYARFVADRWSDFDALSARAAAQAQQNDLREETLKDILAEP